MNKKAKFCVMKMHTKNTRSFEKNTSYRIIHSPVTFSQPLPISYAYNFNQEMSQNLKLEILYELGLKLVQLNTVTFLIQTIVPLT